MPIDPFFSVMYFVSLRLSFNLRPNLDVREYCEGQKLVKCYNGSLWKSNYAPRLFSMDFFFGRLFTIEPKYTYTGSDQGLHCLLKLQEVKG